LLFSFIKLFNFIHFIHFIECFKNIFIKASPLYHQFHIPKDSIEDLVWCQYGENFLFHQEPLLQLNTALDSTEA
jgi:hypothetical protein